MTAQLLGIACGFIAGCVCTSAVFLKVCAEIVSKTYKILEVNDGKSVRS